MNEDGELTIPIWERVLIFFLMLPFAFDSFLSDRRARRQ